MTEGQFFRFFFPWTMFIKPDIQCVHYFSHILNTNFERCYMLIHKLSSPFYSWNLCKWYNFVWLRSWWKSCLYWKLNNISNSFSHIVATRRCSRLLCLYSYHSFVTETFMSPEVNDWCWGKHLFCFKFDPFQMLLNNGWHIFF